MPHREVIERTRIAELAVEVQVAEEDEAKLLRRVEAIRIRRVQAIREIAGIADHVQA